LEGSGEKSARKRLLTEKRLEAKEGVGKGRGKKVTQSPEKLAHWYCLRTEGERTKISKTKSLLPCRCTTYLGPGKLRGEGETHKPSKGEFSDVWAARKKKLGNELSFAGATGSWELAQNFFLQRNRGGGSGAREGGVTSVNKVKKMETERGGWEGTEVL